MNNTRTIAALERSIAQLTKLKERLSATEARPQAHLTRNNKSATKKTAAKRTMTPEHKARISAAQTKRYSLKKSPAKKRAAKKTA